MPDWQELVCRHLFGLPLDTAEKDEIHAELAAHLEDAYESMLRDGINDAEAVKRTLCLADDWHDLQRKITLVRSGKDTMTNRVTQLWLPGLVTFVLSGGILALMQILRLKPWILTKSGDLTIAVLYVWWLMLLPLVGALGAYLSWRAGGSQRAILLSIVFPVLPFLASILVVLPVSLIFDRFIAHIAPMSLTFALFGWVLGPAAALLAGGLTIQHFLSRRSSVDGVASR